MSDLRSRLQGMAAKIASQHGIDPALFQAVIQQESNWQPGIVSHAGAIGLGQLMPSTAKALGVDPRDPAQNLDASARYLKQQLDRFGDPRLALAAYNAGPNAVTHYGGVPPFPETHTYVTKILGAVGSHGGGPISWDNPGGGGASPSLAPAAGGQISWDNPTAAAPKVNGVRISELSKGTRANLTGLNPALQSALSGAADELMKQGLDIGPLITSGYRSSADQARLYANRAHNPNPVARPGHSAHESGNALDIAVHHLSPELQQTVLSTLGKYGLTRPVANDPVHFQLQGAKSAPASAPSQISWANPG